jgi:hypothetical protein
MAWMTILFTGSEASPLILTLLVSGGDPVFYPAPEISGFGPPHPATSKTAVATDHTFMCMGKH